MQNRLTFTEAVNLTLLENYCNFEGRASRSEFWWWALFCVAVAAVECMVAAMLGHSLGVMTAWIVSLLLLSPTLGIMARRLHDIGRSGLWALLAPLPPVNLMLIYWLTLPSRGAVNSYGVAPFTDFD